MQHTQSWELKERLCIRFHHLRIAQQQQLSGLAACAARKSQYQHHRRRCFLKASSSHSFSFFYAFSSSGVAIQHMVWRGSVAADVDVCVREGSQTYLSTQNT
jgi:hypothetical protein